MAFPNVFEIEEPGTGKKYRVEGVEGTTRDEAIQYLSSLPEDEIAKREIRPQTPVETPAQAPVPAGSSGVQTPEVPSPATPAQQGVEEIVTPGVATAGEPFRFPDEIANQITAAAADPNVSYEQYNELVKGFQTQFGQPALGTVGGQATLDAYRAARPEDRLGVGYTPWTDSLELNEMGSSFEDNNSWLAQTVRSIENAWTDPASGVSAIGRTIADWSDVGGNILDEQYPNLSPEEREAMQEELVGFINRKMFEATEEGVANDDFAPWLFGQFIAPDPIDIVPISRVPRATSRLGRVAEKAGEGAVLSGGADTVYQGLAIADDAQEEFDLGRVGVASALGGALHGTVQGGAEGVSALASTKSNVKAPAGNPDATARYNERVSGYISEKTKAKRPSKKVRQEAAAQGLADHINDTVEGWENAPTFEVHQNFEALDGIDNDALAAIGPDGQVVVNLENVTAEAKARGISPTDVTTAITYHEALGHHGMTQMFGDGLDTVLTKMYEEGPEFRSKVDDWLTANPDAYQGDPNRVARAADEVLAEMSEAGPLPASIINRFKNYIKDLARNMGLKLDYTNREIETILGMAHRAVIDGKGRDVAGNGFRYMYTGLRGNSPINERGFPVTPRGYEDAVTMTEQILGDTLPPEIPLFSKEADAFARKIAGPGSIVHKETGWFIGPDRRWRMEIDDSMAEFDLDFSEIGSGVSLTMSEVLDHPALYDLYPDLKDVRVIREAPLSDLFGSLQGSFDPATNTINITPKAKNPEGTLLHEIQHWIQEKEGFSSGGSTSSALKSIPNSKLMKVSDRVAKYYNAEANKLKVKKAAFETALADPTVQAYARAYHNWRQTSNLTSDNPIAKQAYSHMVDAERDVWEKLTGVRNYSDISPVDRDQLGELLFNARPNAEGQSGLVDAINQLSEEIRENTRRVLGITAAKNDPDHLRKVLQKDEYLPFQAYQHLFGEVEARDTANRQYMTDDQRRVTTPYTSEDFIEPNDYIFDRGLGPSEEMSGRVPTREAIAKASRQFGLEPGSVQAVNRARIEQFKDSSRGGLSKRDTSELDQYIKEQAWERRLRKAVEEYNKKQATPAQVETVRYMKKKSKEVSTDDLFESENALDILRSLTADYQPIAMTMDDLKVEAEMRGKSADALLRNKALDIGELPRRFIMMDIAADKLNEKVSKLYAKIQSGQGTYKDRVAHAQALLKFKELSARIFDEQGEAGRLLRTIQELQYTRRKITGLQGTLEEFNAEGLKEILSDPDAYMRFAKAIQDQMEESAEVAKKSKISDRIANVLNVPRAIMSSMDVSAPFRQGLFLVGRPEFWKSLPSMFRYLASEGAYTNLMRDIVQRPDYDLMLKAKIAFTGREGKLSSREEAFQSDLVKKIPIFGKAIGASERAYNGFLNKLRADVFDSMIRDARELNVDVRDAKFLKSLGSFINHATGRGHLGGVLNAASPLLNALFFSPRLIASRAQLLNPGYYATLHPFVRKQAIKSLLSATGFVLTVLTLSGLAGAEVETDPRSSDFGKVKVGNTRYDIPGGFAQYITLGARLISGQQKNAIGEIKEYGNEFGQKTRLDALATFFSNKASPNASFVMDAFRGVDAVGEPFDLTTAVGSRLAPMITQDVIEVMDEHGFAEGALRIAPGFIGVGVQNYTPSAIDPEKEVQPPNTFEMQELEDGENEFISVTDGVVTLKGPAKEEWERRLNFYVREWMRDEMANPEWSGLSVKEKAEVIEAVRKDARKQTKEDMLPILGITEPEEAE